MGKPKNKYAPEALLQAYEMVRSKRMTLGKASKLYNIPKTTLGDKLRGKHPLQQAPRTVLSPEDEQKLVSWLIETSRRGCGRTREQLLRTVQHILKRNATPNPFKDDKPGDKWYASFLKRHPEISLRKTQGLGQQRALVTEARIRNWFQEASTQFQQEGIDIMSITPDRVWNCDETGFPFNAHTGYVLASKEDKQVYQITSDNKQQITVLGCGAADGTLLKPLIIYPGQRFRFNPQADFPDSDFARSKNGWIDAEIFYTWMKTSFLPSVKKLRKPVFLFVDGHTTHISMELHHLCREHQIVYYTLPANASHVIQPLDLILYKSLKVQWRSAVAAFRDIKNDNVKKDTFALVLRDAWKRAYAPDKLVNAFRAAGLHPWNPDQVNYKKLMPSKSFQHRLSPVASLSAPAPVASPSAPTPASLSAPTPASLSGPTPASLSGPTPASQSAPTPVASPSAPTPASLSGPTPASQSAPTPVASLSRPAPVASLSGPAPASLSAPTPVASPPAPTPVASPPAPAPVASQSGPTPASLSAPVASPSSPVASTSGSAPQASTSAPCPHPTCPTSLKFYVDMLLDHVVGNNWSPAHLFEMQRRLNDNTPPTDTHNNDFTTFRNIYNKIVPLPSFDSLPITAGWGVSGQRSRAPRRQPPKYVASQQFADFFDAKEKELERKKDEKEREKRERNEKKKLKEEEKERKKAEREAKMLERGKGTGKKGQHGGKRARVVVEDSETSESEREIVYMEESSLDSILVHDKNVCCVCNGGDEETGWVGCDVCERWFHKDCLSERHAAVYEMSEDELKKFAFVCDFCI